MAKWQGNMSSLLSRLGVQTLLLATLALSVSSCSLVGRKSIPDDALKLTLTPAAPVVRPGEAVFVEAKLENTSKKQHRVRILNSDSLVYLWWSESNATPSMQRAEASANEDRTLPVDIPAQSSVVRKFVLTRVSGEPGKYMLQGMYSTPVGRKGKSTAISVPVGYEVAGDRLFTRGDDGLIVREDAIRLSKDYLGRPTTSESANLVKNEAGNFDWWVTLTVSPSALAAGERAEKGFFVNAHVGEVRKEAKPQEKSTKEETPIPAVSRRNSPETKSPAPSEPGTKK